MTRLPVATIEHSSRGVGEDGDVFGVRSCADTQSILDRSLRSRSAAHGTCQVHEHSIQSRCLVIRVGPLRLHCERPHAHAAHRQSASRTHVARAKLCLAEGWTSKAWPLSMLGMCCAASGRLRISGGQGCQIANGWLIVNVVAISGEVYLLGSGKNDAPTPCRSQSYGQC